MIALFLSYISYCFYHTYHTDFNSHLTLMDFYVL
uniref:Uncharacterized protein n=1 Tax=Anguilla anguilla TaxID=7936 RepID=A0A0E9QTB5_ANGAN